MLNLIIPSYPFLFIFLLRVTPTANRNSYRVAILVGQLPRVEALHASTLGWGNATPTELPGVRTINYGITAHGRRACTVNNGITIHNPRLRTIHNGLTIHGPRVQACHNGLTIHDPRMRTIHNGLTIHGHIESTSSSNSVGGAISRRRYTQSDNTLLLIPIHFPAAGNAYG